MGSGMKCGNFKMMYEDRGERDSLVAGQDGKAEGKSSPILVSNEAVAHQGDPIAAMHDSSNRCISVQSALFRARRTQKGRRELQPNETGKGEAGAWRESHFCRLATLFVLSLFHFTKAFPSPISPAVHHITPTAPPSTLHRNAADFAHQRFLDDGWRNIVFVTTTKALQIARR